MVVRLVALMASMGVVTLVASGCSPDSGSATVPNQVEATSDIVASAIAEIEAITGLPTGDSDQLGSVPDDDFNSQPRSGSGPCDPNYDGPCVPLVDFDLDCPDIEGPVYIIGYDVHAFDRDGDGVGCEPWSG